MLYRPDLPGIRPVGSLEASTLKTSWSAVLSQPSTALSPCAPKAKNFWDSESTTTKQERPKRAKRNLKNLLLINISRLPISLSSMCPNPSFLDHLVQAFDPTVSIRRSTVHRAVLLSLC